MINPKRRKKIMVFLLAVFGMLCWGIAPIFAKLALRDVDSMAGLTLRTLFAASVVLVFSAANGTIGRLGSISLKSWGLIAIEAVLATLVGDLAYFAAIKRGEVSLVTIIMSSSPLITIICAALFLNEQITLLRLLGTAMVILGIILIV